MCTSFTYRGNDTLIAMNYDNNGMNLRLERHNPKLFLVTINSFGQNRPLFGVRNDGIFANQQVVDECTGGKFKIGYRVTHTADLIKKVLYGKITMDKLDNFLGKHQIVNPPKNSLHTMITDAKGSCYIVEPGRGNLKYEQSKRYVVMSNCPIYGAQENGQYDGFGVDRQLKAEEMLKAADENFDVTNAFDVLKAVHQTDSVWHTEFSFVYFAKENAVYYCYNHEFDNIQKYQMEVLT